jgi:uncharacterized protein (DUF58 family)
VERFVPARKGRRHAMRIVSEILQFRAQSPRTSLGSALQFLRNAFKRRTIAFVLSDFIDNPPAPDGRGAREATPADAPVGWERALKVAARKHDLVPVRLTDRLEAELPDAGLALLEDPETGEVLRVDLSDRRLRARFAAAARADEERLRKLFAKLDLDAISVRADDADYVKPLLAFFGARARRRG